MIGPWKKGTLIKVNGKWKARVLDDGIYISDETFGLWCYSIQFSDGHLETRHPRIGDVMVRR